MIKKHDDVSTMTGSVSVPKQNCASRRQCLFSVSFKKTRKWTEMDEGDWSTGSLPTALALAVSDSGSRHIKVV
jgi:hypothetical protein